MKKNVVWFAVVLTVLLAEWVQPFPSMGQGKLRYSCSAQVYEAFERERLEAFNKATGMEVELYLTSSPVALERIMSGEADIAGVVRKRSQAYNKEPGMMEIPFSRDPLAIIVHPKNRLTNLSEEQLRDIFSKKISNWRQLNGPEEPILLVIPGKSTAAYENFGQMALKRKEIPFDVMTNLSTLALEVVKRFPSAISFVTQGAVAKTGGVKMVKINGVSPKDKGYPYYQEFSFVTKGKPAGGAKAFVDFALSEKGKAIIRDRGMVPLSLEK